MSTAAAKKAGAASESTVNSLQKFMGNVIQPKTAGAYIVDKMITGVAVVAMYELTKLGKAKWDERNQRNEASKASNTRNIRSA